MLQQGNGLFIPNSNDAICGEYKDHDISNTTTVSVLQLGRNKQNLKIIQIPSSEIESKNSGLIADQEASITPSISEETEGEEEDDNEPLTSPSPFVQQLEENQQISKDKQQNVSIITPGRIKPIRIIPNAQYVTAIQSNVGKNIENLSF